MQLVEFKPDGITGTKPEVVKQVDLLHPSYTGDYHNDQWHHIRLVKKYFVLMIKYLLFFSFDNYDVFLDDEHLQSTKEHYKFSFIYGSLFNHISFTIGTGTLEPNQVNSIGIDELKIWRCGNVSTDYSQPCPSCQNDCTNNGICLAKDICACNQYFKGDCSQYESKITHFYN